VGRSEFERRWRNCFGATAADRAAIERAMAADFPRMVREAEERLVARVGTPAESFARIMAQADGDPGDDYAVERAGA
jgi:hypothetical protein